MFKNVFFLLVGIIIFTSVILSGFRLLSHPSVEYDEGAYLTTFLLVNNGNILYEKTYFSQFPGFFYSTYPTFVLFGKTLEAGRLAVFIWSIVTLIGILWLSYEAVNILLGIFAIAILYNTQLFFNQSLTFHADAIPLAFSTLSISSMLRFWKKHKLFWFILSVIFLSFSILIKLEASVILSLLLIFTKVITQHKISFKKIFFFSFFSLLLFLAIFYLSVLPFGGVIPFYNSALLTRIQSTFNEPFSAMRLWEYLIDSQFLLIVIITSIILSIYHVVKIKKERLVFFVLLFWSLTVIFFLFIYRPLFPHHLVLLTVPFSLLLSYLLILNFKSFLSLKYINIGIFLFVLYTFSYLLISSFSYHSNSANALLNKGLEIISKNSTSQDYIVSDDGFLTAFSKRMPPPWLVDISDVRVRSGSLSSEDFEKIIKEYKPRLIMPWSGRLKKIKNFERILKENNYNILKTIDKDHEALILYKRT